MLRAAPPAGLGELGCGCAQPTRAITLGELRARGLGEGFEIYTTAQEALRAGYGQLYREGGDVKVTTPYGGIAVRDATTVYPDQRSALAQPGGAGFIFKNSQGGFSITGPAGPIALNAVYAPAVAALPVAPPSSPTGSSAPAPLPVPSSPAIPAMPALDLTRFAGTVATTAGITPPQTQTAVVAGPSSDPLGLLSQLVPVPVLGDVPAWQLVVVALALGLVAARGL
jgi:hypothetical protein